MQVLVWVAADGPIPPQFKYTTRILEDGTFLPVTFHGPTQGDAEDKAAKFWATELKATQEKLASTIAAAKKAKVKKGAATAAEPVVDDDEEEAV